MRDDSFHMYRLWSSEAGSFVALGNRIEIPVVKNVYVLFSGS